MGKIFIRDLKVDAVIGVHDWERDTRQTLHVDIDMAYSIVASAATDCLNDTLDYSAVSERVTDFIQDRKAQLIETLAEGIARLLMHEFCLPWVKVTIRKPGAVIAANHVGVSIERGEWPLKASN